MAKIYISSTFEDLKEMRARAYDQLRKSRHDVISMEDYNPGTRRPFAKCLADVRATDIYVGLIGWRYGYMPGDDNPDGLSITEREYREAVTAGKEIIVFMVDENAPWPPPKMDSHTGAGASGTRIKAFRDQISRDHIRGVFTTADNLAANLSPAVEEACARLSPPNTGQLEHIPTLTRDQLELLASRFGAQATYDQSDADLRDFLTKKAAEYRAYRAEIEAIDERTKGLGNLKAAARDAAENLNFEEVETLLSRVHEVEVEIASETAELRAGNALLRGRVQQAYELLSAAADSFAGIDETAGLVRRLDYGEVLRAHGHRYGGNGLDLAIQTYRPIQQRTSKTERAQLWANATVRIGRCKQELGTRLAGSDGSTRFAEAVDAYRDALSVYTKMEEPNNWATTQNNLGNALRAQGSRTGGPDGATLLAGAVTAFRAALTVTTQADHPVDWAQTQNNLGAALAEQGSRTGGPDGAALLAEAVTAYRAALTVRTQADHPVDWAMTQNNLGTALEAQGSRTGGPEGAALLAEAVNAYRAALIVYTQADHPVDWAMTQNNLGNALAQQGSRTGGPNGAALLAKAVTAYRAALTVYTQADHPVDWAQTQENLALAEQAIADHATTPDPRPHLAAALAHVEAALTVFDPQHMRYNFDKAAALRDALRDRIDGTAS